MSKAGKKILKGVREAVAVAQGKKMPARVTAFAWTWWHPLRGFALSMMTEYELEPDPHLIVQGWRKVRVRITMPATGKGK